MSKEWVNNLGKILESRQGKIYIKLDKDCTLLKGDVIFLSKFKDDVARLVEGGHITEDEAEAKLEKQSFVKYILTKPPRKE